MIGQISTPTSGLGEDRVDDLPPAPVADRVPAVVDGIGHAQVLRYPLVQLGLLGGGETRQGQPRRRRQVGEVRPLVPPEIE